MSQFGTQTEWFEALDSATLYSKVKHNKHFSVIKIVLIVFLIGTSTSGSTNLVCNLLTKIYAKNIEKTL